MQKQNNIKIIVAAELKNTSISWQGQIDWYSLYLPFLVVVLDIYISIFLLIIIIIIYYSVSISNHVSMHKPLAMIINH
ncbi:hypothetical protein ACJX0J_020434, partial [Zea mays]